VPLLVKKTDDREAGNSDLIRKGAAEVPAEVNGINVERLFEASANTRRADNKTKGEIEAKPAAPLVESATDDAPSFYRIFLERIQPKCSSEPRTPDDLAGYIDVNKPQLNAWLKRATSEGRVKKLTKPVRYQWTGQNTIFK